MLRTERDYHISMQNILRTESDASKHVKSWKRLSHKQAKHVI